MLRFDSPQKFEIIEDANGYLLAQGVIASSGEQLIYRDGIETITDDALFENIDEWEGLPVTMEHPKSGLLNPSNTQKYQVGSVIKAWRKDNELWAKFRVTVKDAIDSVKSGLRGLSAGYKVALNADGTKQIGRLNNHLALVETGRSPSSGIRSDERRDSYDINGEHPMLIKFPDGATVKLDCADSEGQLLQTKIDALASRADAAEEEVKKVDKELTKVTDAEEDMPVSEKLLKMKMMMDQAKKDGESAEKLKELQGKYDEMKEQVEKSKEKMDSSEFTAIIDTLEKVQSIDPSIKLRTDSGKLKSECELIEEGLKAHNKDVKLDSADKGDAKYMRARLDAAIEVREMMNLSSQRPAFNANRGDSGERKMTVQEKANRSFYNPGEAK
ncbi:MAG: DUF2213 domain-containing protein [Plesiomonas shigelloides]